MASSIKKFGWAAARPTRWEHAQAWRAQRKVMTQRFLDESATLNTAFLNAQSALSSGRANLAAKAAVAAVQKRLEATMSKMSSLGRDLDVSA